MTSLEQWALRWGLPPQALEELAIVTSQTGGYEGMSESAVQSRVRLEASKHGVHLWRNNVGAGKLADGGRFIRFGLANDSQQLNKVLKSGDLIGGRRTLITQAMVGQTVLRFTSRECKEGDWKFSGTEEETAQLKWATLINSLGGDAKMVSGPGSFG
jgi:hypothetical protein